MRLPTSELCWARGAKVCSQGVGSFALVHGGCVVLLLLLLLSLGLVSWGSSATVEIVRCARICLAKNGEVYVREI